MSRGFGWAGTVRGFLETSRDAWLDDLAEHHTELLRMPVAQSQLKAWTDEHTVMAEAFRRCCRALPNEAPDWGVVFEYELPMENGRRPDVVVLAGPSLVVLEFKSAPIPTQADIDQTRAYVRDLVDYHEASHQLPHTAVLVTTESAEGWAGEIDQVFVTAPDGVDRYLYEAHRPGLVDIEAWLDADYHPLPTLVDAARRIFRDEPLPHVKRALSAGVPETVELLGRLVDRTAKDSARSLAFVTGVPGAGKTLVGLRLVHERVEAHGRATFLSGNGPLVKVLQDALQSRVFVRDLHAFVKTYALNKKPKTPEEHVIVFDEAQRAWDEQYMHHKKGVARSEPSLLIDIGERIDGWATLVGLVGEGQEIHSGEEGGMEQWRDAACPPNAKQPWRVHCPPKLADQFEGLDVETHERLDLTVTLRSRRAEHLHQWVRLLLEGSIRLAARHAVRIQADAFPMYLTRDLEEAKRYVRSRLDEDESLRGGLLASSHAKILDSFGVDRGFRATNRMNNAAWFNAPTDDPRSSNRLEQPVTEFGCQGLELDLPIVCWGTDYRWAGKKWDLTPIRRRYPQDDPEQLLRNTYRVLLTRGREGLVIFVPPVEALDQTEVALLAAGVKPMPEAEELALRLVAI